MAAVSPAPAGSVGPLDRPAYWAIRAAIRGAIWGVLRPHVTGQELVPPSGGLIVASNHVSLADPLVLLAACPRPLAYMAKEELFRPPILRALARVTRAAFPVRRGETDVRAVREAIDLLRGGLAVVIFPEGTRHPEGLGKGHSGVCVLARRAGCPILPVGIAGTEPLQRPSALRRWPRVEVRFGEPFSPSTMASSALAVEEMMGRIAALLPAERRGRYA